MVKKVWEGYMPPFRVAGNIYFVGTKGASAHIIDTGEGLIMLDSGYLETLYLTMDGMSRLGFSIYDIKYILHSHGHIDHFGSTRPLVELTGAKTIIGRPDEDYATGKRDLSFAKELNMHFDGFFTPDILLDDGDVFTLGNTSIRCVHTPGHTEGCMSFFFDTEHNGKTYRVGNMGGAGMNSMAKDFLLSHDLPLTLRDDFKAAIKRLRSEKVDIFIGNHQQQCHTVERYERIKNGDEDAFIDQSAWGEFLDDCDMKINRLLESEKE